MKSRLVLATAAVIISIVFMSVYIIGQQTIRLSANIPQIEQAQDVATKLNNGTSPDKVLSVDQKIDIAKSSAGFIIIYDKSGKVVYGSGQLDGVVPTIPYGVLENTHSDNYHAVTWQPKSGIRIASVEVKANDYYVLSGRSLNEPEKLVETIGKLTLVGYVFAEIALGLGWLGFMKSKT